MVCIIDTTLKLFTRRIVSGDSREVYSICGRVRDPVVAEALTSPTLSPSVAEARIPDFRELGLPDAATVLLVHLPTDRERVLDLRTATSGVSVISVWGHQVQDWVHLPNEGKRSNEKRS